MVSSPSSVSRSQQTTAPVQSQSDAATLDHLMKNNQSAWTASFYRNIPTMGAFKHLFNQKMPRYDITWNCNDKFKKMINDKFKKAVSHLSSKC